MVFCVYGLLGGGKSYSCVKMMLDELRRGNAVLSNIRLKDDFLRRNKINASKYTYIDDFGGVDPWTFPTGALRGSGSSYKQYIVIDEAGEWLDSYGDARRKDSQLANVASWLRQSDKLGQEVYFIVQFETLLHARLRNIVHRWICCTDLGKFKLPLVGLGLPFGLRNFIVLSEYDGKNKEAISRHWLLKDRRIFSAYDTAAFFGSSFANSSEKPKLTTNGFDYSSVSDTSFPWFVYFLVLVNVVLLCASFFLG